MSELKKTCKEQADKMPVNGNLFENGKQQAYSHVYFELEKVSKKLDWILGDRNLIKLGTVILSYILGFLSCMWAFGILKT